MRSSHIELKNKHKNRDIWVIGSGASMGFVDKSFFENKITIGPCQVWKYFNITYNLHKHQQFIKEAYDNGQVVIASKHDCGDVEHPLNEEKGIHYIFTHKKGRFGELETNFIENLNAVGKDEDIFVSYSTITSCIHMAAYMGASNIIICGHDCGWIDKKSHMFDYGKRLIEFYGTIQKFNEYHNMWFERVDNDSRRLRDKLKEVYRCNIYSLNPFLNFGLEGHIYDTKQ